MSQTIRGASHFGFFRFGYPPDVTYNFIGFRIAIRRDRYRMYRGGAFQNWLRKIGCTDRFQSTPTTQSGHIGFRIVRRKKWS